MSVTIRLQRQGSKSRPTYLIVAMDKKRQRDGLYLERLGQYFPKEKDPKAKIKVNMEALNAWKAKGARVSQTVGQLIGTQGK